MALAYICPQHELWFSDDYADNKVLWVNAFEVTRHYGGPEEGGWYYDAGTILVSIPCFDDKQVNEAIERLKQLFVDDYKDRTRRYSAIGEEDLEIDVSENQGKSYPEVTPHYE